MFVDRVREKEKSNPKFSFLNTGDAYAAFYNWRLSEIKAGRGTAVSAGRAGEPAAAPEPEKPKGPEAPPDFHFAARMPNMNALDLEVVKLTALFVAKRGKSFMTALSQRETRNFQFDFLRPQHSLYQFFTRLVDQYRELLQVDGAESAQAEKLRLSELDKNVKNKFHILDRAKQRAEWVKFQEQQKQKQEEEEEEEKIEYAQIDWHDFVVVETVVFTDADDQAELPPPTSLNDLQTTSLEQKAMMSLQPHDRRIEEAMPTEDETTYYNAYPEQPQPQQQQQQQQQQPETQQPFSPPIIAAEEEQRIRERNEAQAHAHATQAAARAVPSPGPGQPPPMRIRSDYVPRAQAKRLTSTTQATAICPNCRQNIPINEMEHHMRIELLDPRWKEQRAKADARYATTNLSVDDARDSIKRLASQRSDVFDPVPDSQATANANTNIPAGGAGAGAGAGGDMDPEEETRRKRLAMSGQGGLPVPPHMHMPLPNTAPAPGSIPGYEFDSNTNQAPGVGPPNPAAQQQGQAQAQAQAQAQGQQAHPVNIEEQIRKIHEKMKQ